MFAMLWIAVRDPASQGHVCPKHTSMTKFNHQQNMKTPAILREVVFGVEDGMVSTLGAVSGIAIGTQDRFSVLLAGARGWGAAPLR